MGYMGRSSRAPVGAVVVDPPNQWLMLPMWFMLITTVAALGLMVRDNLINAAKPNWVLGGMAILLLVLALLMVLQAFSALKRRDGAQLSHSGD